MSQSFLMAPSGKPIRAKPRDPYSADDFDDFLALFLTANNRAPSGPEMLTFYEGHQDQYQDKFNEPWSALAARKKKFTDLTDVQKRRQAGTRFAKGVQ